MTVVHPLFDEHAASDFRRATFLVMAHKRTAWHVMFHALLQERRPQAFDVLAEVPLSHEPQRADYLLLRRREEAAVDDAGVLRGLWPRIRVDSVMELKTRSSPLARGDLCTLLGYGAQYAAGSFDRLRERDGLLLSLVLPGQTSTLGEELRFLGATLGPMEHGYASIVGLTFPACVVLLDEVSAAERDEILGLFGMRPELKLTARQWLHAHLWRRDGVMADERIEDLEGYEDMMLEMLAALPPELRLKGLAPEQRLAGLAPEQRLAGLAPEQIVAGLAPEDLDRLRELLHRKVDD